MPSLLEEIMRRRRPELAGILGGDTPPSSTARVAGLLGEAPPSRPGGLLDSRTSPSGAGQRLIQNQRQQQAQFGAQTEQMRRQSAQQEMEQQRQQQLRARQARQRGVGRNREPGPGEQGLGFFGKLFVGQEIDGLTKREHEGLRRQSMITAGLSMLASSGRGHDSPTLAQALAGGIMAGRQTAAQTAGELLDEKRAQAKAVQYRRIFDSADLSEIERWEEARRLAVKRGDMDSVKVFNTTLKELRNTEEGELDSVIRKGPDGRDYQFITHDDGSVTVKDPFSNEVVGEQPAPPQDEDEVFQRTDKLADDFRSETRALQESIALGTSAQQAGDNSAGDLSLIFSYNKLIDPGSRVTEGEVQAGKNLGGLTAQARGFVDRFAEGRLPGPAREELMQEINRMLESRAQQLGGISQQFRARAQAFGVRPDFVVRRGLIPDLGGGASQNGNGGQVSTGAGTSGAPVLFPEEDEDEGGI